jgi:hypothetical protein
MLAVLVFVGDREGEGITSFGQGERTAGAA